SKLHDVRVESGWKTDIKGADQSALDSYMLKTYLSVVPEWAYRDKGKSTNFVQSSNTSIDLKGGLVNEDLYNALTTFSKQTGYNVCATMKRGTTRNGEKDSKKSQHYKGNAIDFYMTDGNGNYLSPEETADLAYQSRLFNGIEISRTPGVGSFVHVDLRSSHKPENPVLFEQVSKNPYKYKYGDESEYWKTYKEGKYIKYPK
ncbi:MAG TPA: hypothetical protein P5509_10805, partial [Bacteroidales bacterium]|nr:hypothetical protein [Bacteroidales bacterium]